MSDHSAIQNVVKLSEIDCKLFCTSTSTAELSTARVVRVDDDKRDRGVYIPPGFTRWVRAMGGDTTKAHTLSQIIFWFKLNEKGTSKISKRAKGNPAFWLIKEYDELAAEVGITEKMIKDAIKWACEVGIIIKELHGFGGKRATYMRFACANGERNITGHEQVMDFAYPIISTHRSLPYGPTGTLHTDPQVFSNTESTPTESTDTNQNIKDAHEQSFAKTATPAKTSKADGKPIPEQQKDNFLMPSKEAVLLWEKFEIEYSKAANKEFNVPGWNKAKAQPLQRFEHEIKQAGHDPLAILAWLNPYLWQKVGFDVDWSDAMPNTLYLKAHAQAFFDAYYKDVVLHLKKPANNYGMKTMNVPKPAVKTPVVPMLDQLKQQQAEQLAKAKALAEIKRKAAVEAFASPGWLTGKS